MASVESYFMAVQRELEEAESRREEIVSCARVLSTVRRKLDASLEKIHTTIGDSKGLEPILKGVENTFAELKDKWAAIDTCIGQESIEKYYDLWRSNLTQFVMISVFLHWLTTKSLLNKEEAEKKLYLGKGNGCRINLDFQVYLTGLCGAPRELARLCVNLTSHGRYSLLKDISKFVTDLYAGFRLLNLKNDSLRRKFDSIKYSVQKIEEVIYDVKVRKLVDEKSPTPSNL
ncbi:hypothetical protein AAMO2058_001484400 [Amorphochlora amoebiformis]